MVVVYETKSIENQPVFHAVFVFTLGLFHPFAYCIFPQSVMILHPRDLVRSMLRLFFKSSIKKYYFLLFEIIVKWITIPEIKIRSILEIRLLPYIIN